MYFLGEQSTSKGIIVDDTSKAVMESEWKQQLSVNHQRQWSQAMHFLGEQST
jgi:hypothetical protein